MSNASLFTERAWLAQCGNYCGDCLLFHGEVADLARVLLRRLKQMERDHSTHHSPRLPQDIRYQQYCHRLYEALYDIDMLRCTRPCREGGGSECCAVRECCNGRGLEGCWECADLTQCPMLRDFCSEDFKDKMRTLLEIRENGPERFLESVQTRSKRAAKTSRCHRSEKRSG